jgi:hypothetical protein
VSELVFLGHGGPDGPISWSTEASWPGEKERERETERERERKRKRKKERDFIRFCSEQGCFKQKGFGVAFRPWPPILITHRTIGCWFSQIA